MVYVTMLSVAQDRPCIAANCWIINERRIGKDVGWSSCGIRLEWMRKTAKTSDSRCLGRDLKLVASQYRWNFFVPEPTCSVKYFRPDI